MYTAFRHRVAHIKACFDVSWQLITDVGDTKFRCFIHRFLVYFDRRPASLAIAPTIISIYTSTCDVRVSLCWLRKRDFKSGLGNPAEETARLHCISCESADDSKNSSHTPGYYGAEWTYLANRLRRRLTN